jgi:putative RecB family exonuclease
MAPHASTAQDHTVPDMTTTNDDLVAEMREKIAAAADKNALAALPKKLSPSRANNFKGCPQQFYFRTIARISTPQSFASLRGTIAHGALERIFDHPPGERTAELAITYVRPHWESIINPDLEKLNERDRGYAESAQKDALEIITPGTDVEADLLKAAEDCVRNWFSLEKVNTFTPTNLELPDGRTIDGRELWVAARLAGVDVNGRIDRVDRWYTPDQVVHWSVTDYKSSAQAPWLKKPYRRETVERIKDENFFQLKVYAAVLWKMFGIQVEWLRLIYIGTDDRETGVQQLRVTREMIDATVRDLESTWGSIKRAARTGVWPTKTGPLCDWCHFQPVCPAFSSPDDEQADKAAASN